MAGWPEPVGGVALGRRVVREALPHGPALAGILVLDLLAAPLALLTPLPLKIAVDSAVGSDPLPGFLAALVPASLGSSRSGLLALAAGLQLIILVLLRLQDMAAYVLRTWLGEQLTLRFRAKLFRHAQRLALGFYDARGSTDSIYRIQYDAPAIRWVTVEGLLPVASAAATLLAMFYVMARISLELALVTLAVAPFVVLLGRGYDRRMRDHYLDQKELESRALTVVHEVLSAVRVVKAFAREDRERDRFLRRSHEGARARVRLAVAEAALLLAANSLTAIGTALVLWLGIRSVVAGSLSLGEFLVVVSYVAQLYGPLEFMTNQIAHLQSSLASARRAFALLDEVPEVAERGPGRRLTRVAGAIEFRDVSFGYDGERLALENVSFAVAAGMRVGIIGSSGAGKTTLVSLLNRFYDPSAGRILLDGVDIREYRLADLRSQFAIVPQEPVLFSTTLAENIAYARPEASGEEIEAAANAAHADEFIRRLPQGYQTEVGERGVRLSGGERQRIALARAFLKDAPVLILDEPTSSVDDLTEAEILEAMERLTRGRTTFVIAHRATTLVTCEVLLEIEGGRVVELRRDDVVAPGRRRPSDP